VHQRDEAEATIEATARARIQRLVGALSGVGCRAASGAGRALCMGVGSYRASGLGSFESVDGGERASPVQEQREAQRRRTSLWATREARRERGDPGRGDLQPVFPCLMQPLPRPCVIPMRVAQSRGFTVGNTTRERLSLEYHSNKAVCAGCDGGHAWARTRSLWAAGMTPASSAFRNLG
jgi:hypothetical protein